MTMYSTGLRCPAALLLLALAQAPVALSLQFQQALGGSRTSCTKLVNEGTHSTVDVLIGTPPQRFSVVADTGSNNLIVPSCICQERNACDQTDRCFTGTNKSRSFSIQYVGDDIPAYELNFGSGTIVAVQASDNAIVGGLRTMMHDDLMLMVDKALDFGGSFEGILGLGPPASTMDYYSEWLKAELPNNKSQGLQQALWQAFPRSNILPPSSSAMTAQRENQEPTEPSDQGFLDEAHVDRFSMCFNEGKDGVLRLQPKAQGKAHGSIGQMHWGLGFQGISVGNSNKPALFCDTTPGGQDTACGIIPDSGTTLVMGPEDQIDMLLEGICENWERCRNNFSASALIAETQQMPLEVNNSRKKSAMMIKMLLSDCANWGKSDDYLQELPSLHFRVAGAGKTSEILEIPPMSYVMEYEEEPTEPEYLDIPGYGRVEVGEKAVGKKRKVCDVMFDVMDYNTEANGPVWIMGTPLFYEYHVQYDLKSRPPSMAFTSTRETACGSCGGDSSDLMAMPTPRPRTPRQIRGPPRRPTRIDTSRPL